MSNKPCKHVSESGQSLLELALVLLVIILLVSGVVDLGRVFVYFQGMRDATEEGAAYGSAFPLNPDTGMPNCEVIKDRVKLNLPPDIPRSAITVKYSNNAEPPVFTNCESTLAVKALACSGNKIYVSVIKPDFPMIMPQVSLFVGQQIPLESHITTTMLQPICP